MTTVPMGRLRRPPGRSADDRSFLPHTLTRRGPARPEATSAGGWTGCQGGRWSLWVRGRAAEEVPLPGDPSDRRRSMADAEDRAEHRPAPAQPRTTWSRCSWNSHRSSIPNPKDRARGARDRPGPPECGVVRRRGML